MCGYSEAVCSMVKVLVVVIGPVEHGDNSHLRRHHAEQGCESGGDQRCGPTAPLVDGDSASTGAADGQGGFPPIDRVFHEVVPKICG